MERLYKVQREMASKYANTNVYIHIFIMTSIHTHKETINFFKQHHYFHLNKDYVHFQQNLLPSFDIQNDQIILETKSHISLSPNGNGGTIKV